MVLRKVSGCKDGSMEDWIHSIPKYFTLLLNDISFSSHCCDRCNLRKEEFYFERMRGHSQSLWESEAAHIVSAVRK